LPPPDCWHSKRRLISSLFKCSVSPQGIFSSRDSKRLQNQVNVIQGIWITSTTPSSKQHSYSIGHKIVRRHGSQSPLSCESTIGIFDAYVSFEPAAERKRPEVDVPRPIADRFEADISTGAGDRDIHSLPIPTDAAISADVPHQQEVCKLEATIEQAVRRDRFERPRTWPLRRLGTRCFSSSDSTLVRPKGSLHAKPGVSLDSSVGRTGRAAYARKHRDPHPKGRSPPRRDSD
jgi:hypothetical protein